MCPSMEEAAGLLCVCRNTDFNNLEEILQSWVLLVLTKAHLIPRKNTGTARLGNEGFSGKIKWSS